MLLNLPHLTLLGSEQTEHDICLTVEAKVPPVNCQRCRKLFSKIYAHGSRPQIFHDLPFHGKRVGLKVMRRRFKCTECGATFDEHLEDMHPAHNMTKRLVEYICKAADRYPFTRIADDTGVTEKTIRLIFAEYAEEMRRKYKFVTPEIMGIDEIHINTPRGVITNIGEKTIVEMLPTRAKPAIIKFLQQIKREEVKFVCMDMWNPYREAAYEMLPNAKVVVDRFHVQRMGNNVMERVRKEIRKGLTAKQRKVMKNERHILLGRNFNLLDPQMDRLLEWSKEFPLLGETYELKERFMDIWECGSAVDAMLKYDDWESTLDGVHKVNFKEITTAFKNWDTEIFAWFNFPYTNAFTEAMNGKIRALYKGGRGYTFEVLRAKILFKENIHKTQSVKPRFDRSAFDTFTSFKLPTTPKITNYGTDISTLFSLIDSGAFNLDSTLDSE